MKNGVKYKKNLKINVNSILMICFLVVLFFFLFVCWIFLCRLIWYDFLFCFKVLYDFNFFVEKIGVLFDDEVLFIWRKDEVLLLIGFCVLFFVFEIKIWII